MHNLHQSLQDYDRGLLAIVAELWGAPLATAPAPQAARLLAESVLASGQLEELLAGLSAEARQALQQLQRHAGRMPWAELSRQYGPLREMGAARRDREKPWRQPASALEQLWYRALLARGFADTPKGLEEFGYIPRELLERLPQPASPPRRGLSPPELPPAQAWPAGTTAVDDATTVLAASRLPAAVQPAEVGAHLLRPQSLDLLTALLHELGCLQPGSTGADPDRTRRFLEAARGAAMLQLLRAWIEAPAWNDLAQLDDLAPPKSGWPNHPPSSRQAALALLADLPPERWWSLHGFIQSVREAEPGFLRTGGEFDSWYLQDRRSGEFLQGMAAWDRIEGAVLHYLLSGPLHWLGAVDLGGEQGSDRPTSFRLTELAAAALDPGKMVEVEERAGRSRVAANGQIEMPRLSPRPLRYQVARFGRWLPLDRGRQVYRYQLTAASVEAGREAGLQPRHVLALLREAGGSRLPPTVVETIQRWEGRGVEAQLSRTLVLRVSDPNVLQELRGHPSTARYLKEALDDRQVLVAEADWRALCAAALRRGLLIDWPADPAG